jgi:hypothetical protein
VIIGKCVSPAGKLPALADRAVLELGIDRFWEGLEVYCTAPDDAALRYALAAGASRVDVLSDLQADRAEWILVGPGSLADYGDWLPATLAERLGGSLVFDVQDLLATEGNSLIVLRDLGSGNHDELAITGPAVVVFSAQLVPTRYVSRFRQRAACAVSVPDERQGQNRHEALAKPLQLLAGDWEPVRPRVRLKAAVPGGPKTADDRSNSVFGLHADDTSSKHDSHLLLADPATCAAHLIRYLNHHGLLPRPIPVALSVEQTRPATASRSSQSARQPFIATPAAESKPLATRRPRLKGEVVGRRQRRQPRRAEAPLRTASLPADIARRPRPVGGLAPERRRGPRRIHADSTPSSIR